MESKVCPVCESRNGLNMMKGEVAQLMDAVTQTPKIINWTCGFCGYADSDTVYMGTMGGHQEEKSMIGTFPVEPPEEPVQAVRPPTPPAPEPTVETE